MHLVYLFQLLADIEVSILEIQNVRWLCELRISTDYGFSILDYVSHLTFGFLKIEPSKSAIKLKQTGHLSCFSFRCSTWQQQLNNGFGGHTHDPWHTHSSCWVTMWGDNKGLEHMTTLLIGIMPSSPGAHISVAYVNVGFRALWLKTELESWH